MDRRTDSREGHVNEWRRVCEEGLRSPFPSLRSREREKLRRRTSEQIQWKREGQVLLWHQRRRMRFWVRKRTSGPTSSFHGHETWFRARTGAGAPQPFRLFLCIFSLVVAPPIPAPATSRAHESSRFCTTGESRPPDPQHSIFSAVRLPSHPSTSPSSLVPQVRSSRPSLPLLEGQTGGDSGFV